MLDDFLRVAQGVGMVVLASTKKSSAHLRKATSACTYYPQSPIQQFAYNIKTVQNSPNVVIDKTGVSTIEKIDGENVVRINDNQDNNVQIFFDSYGNNSMNTTSSTSSSSTISQEVKSETPKIVTQKIEPKKDESFDGMMYDSLVHSHKDISEIKSAQEETKSETGHSESDEIHLGHSNSFLKENKVPSNSVSRAIQFAALGIKLGVNTAKEQYFSKKGPEISTETSQQTETEKKNLSVSDVLTEKNAEILADTLCKMRGAALKIGQIMSIQDESTVPPVIQKALEKVRHSANVMPNWQLEQAMSAEFGEEWKSGFKHFDIKPIAAASIGQVHKGILANGKEVAIKVQYPGVADSIESDIRNVERIIKYTNLVPRGAFLGQTMEQARKELTLECDYVREAKNQKMFRKLIQEDVIAEKNRGYVTDVPMTSYSVPEVYDEFTTRRVLCTELIKYGKTIEQIKEYPIEVRNRVAKLILKLCLKELFEYRFMQTDPNWANFFYDPKSEQLHLLDFGACLEFPQEFVDQYLRVVHASATKDFDTVIDASRKMGFLTGEESKEMNEAHATAAMHIGEPFACEGIYDFRSKAIPERVTKIIPTMLKQRLTAPPPVTYSLHRKLSGAFLLCNKLDVAIECREIFLDVYNRYMEKRGHLINKQ